MDILIPTTLAILGYSFLVVSIAAVVMAKKCNIKLSLPNKYTSPYRESAFKFNSEVKEEKRVSTMNKITNIKIPKGLKIFSFVFANALLCVLCFGIWDTGLTSGVKSGISIGSGVLFIYCLITVIFVASSKDN